MQFDEREDAKVCTVVVNDDEVFEGGEGFHVELSMPAYALLGGNRRAVVTINDAEDEPTLQFGRKTFHVNESAGFLRAAIERTGEGGRPVCRLPTTNPYFGNPPPPPPPPSGDPSSTVSALCRTVSRSAQGSSPHALESGSDYKSRGASEENRVVLGPGVTTTTCDVQLIDDSEYELSEEFELVLSDASANARVGPVASAKAVIDGPNDASTVTLGNATFAFSEDAGTRPLQGGSCVRVVL